MIKYFLLLGIFFVSFFCDESLAQQSIIHGSLKSAIDTEFILSEVHVTGISDPHFNRTIFPKSGLFDIKLPNGIYRFIFSAVNHQHCELPLVYAVDDSIVVNINLNRYEYQKSFSSIRIIGNFSDDSYKKSYFLEKGENGVFTFHCKTIRDTVRYQLYGIEKSGRTTNGTDQDYFLYDGEGDYYSCKRVKNSSFDITFTPPLLTEKFIPQTCGNTVIEKLSKYYNLYKDDAQNYYDSVNKDPNNSNVKKNISKKILERITGALKSEGIPLVRQLLFNQYLAAGIAGTAIGETIIDTSILRSVFAEIPLKSYIWSTYNAGLAVFADYQLSPKDYHPSNYVREMFTNHPDAGVRSKVLFVLIELTYFIGEPEKAVEFYSILHSKYPLSKEALDAKLRFFSQDSINFGNSFRQKDAFDPNIVYTKEYFKGKYLLLDFWATWCSPCVAEMPLLHEAVSKHPNLEILSVSLDKSTLDIRKFRNIKWGMPWHHIWLDKGFDDDLAKSFQLKSLPSTYLVDPEGRIVASGEQLRGKSLSSTLEKYLNE